MPHELWGLCWSPRVEPDVCDYENHGVPNAPVYCDQQPDAIIVYKNVAYRLCPYHLMHWQARQTEAILLRR